jgi:prefoldin subunit 5
LRKVGGDVYVEKGATWQADALTSVGGGVSVREGATWQADALTSVGGGVSVEKGATWQADALTSVGGGVSVEKGATCRLQKNPKHNDPDAPRLTAEVLRYCRASLLSSFAAAGYSFADGILARIVSERGSVSRVVICGKTDISYVVKDDEGNFAHGDTLDEARADLMVKRTKGDLTQFKAWTLDKEVSKSDAIMAYRSITGACSKGTRLWLEQRHTPEKITVAGIIEITKGAYGSEAFAQFFYNKSDFAGVAK